MTGEFPVNPPLTPPRRGFDRRTGLLNSPPGRGQRWVFLGRAVDFDSGNLLEAGTPRDDAGRSLRSSCYDR